MAAASGRWPVRPPPGPAATEQKLSDELLGYGVLASLMRNPSVSTIIVNAPTRIFTVSRRGHATRALRALRVRRAGARAGQAARGDGRSAVRRGLAPGGPEPAGRLAPARADAAADDAVHPADHPQIHPFRQTVDHRGRARQHARRLADFISAAVRAHLNIIFSGNSGVGKTTLMRMALLEIDDPTRKSHRYRINARAGPRKIASARR